MHRYTAEQINFLRDKYTDYSRKDLLEAFNNEFGTAITLTQMVSTLKRNKINSGRTGQFQKGDANPNKGRKGWIVPGCEKTWFKKGQVAHNVKPIGTERLDVDGYVLVKTENKGRWHEQWLHKHKVVWEAAHGPIPDNHVVIFLDGNKLNFSLDNLALVTQRENLELNIKRLRFEDKDLTQTGINIAKLLIQIRAKENKN